MMPRILAALAVFLSAVTHMHLTVNAGIATVTVSVPWFILGALIAACAFVAFMIVRSMRARGFRSSPYPRNRFAT